MESRLLILLLVLIFLTGCNNETEEKKNSTDLREYFFPADSLVPYIYAYQERSNPMDEKIFRIYPLVSAGDSTLIVERYNSVLKITEAFTHDLKDSLKITDYMVVDRDGIKRQAEVLSRTSFPFTKSHVAYFVAHFPAHIDSLTMVYESKRHFAGEEQKRELFGKTVQVIKVIDTLKIHLVEPKTKAGNTQKVVTNRYYAKGFGLIGWGSDELNVHYELTRILSNDWWIEYSQEPLVKGDNK